MNFRGIPLLTRLILRTQYDRDTECWIWTGALTPAGYAHIMAWGKPNSLVHRVSWQLKHGEIPQGMCVCHKCDRPSCWNPDHLFLGTHAANMADMRLKGRADRPFGERNPAAKLTDIQVQMIRSDPRPQRAIAREFGIGQTQVSRIKTGLTRKGAPL